MIRSDFGAGLAGRFDHFLLELPNYTGFLGAGHGATRFLLEDGIPRVSGVVRLFGWAHVFC